MHIEIKVRPVESKDLDTLANLEQEIWEPLGTPILTHKDILAWYDEHSPFFLIAENDGVACGYYFGRLIRFSLARLDLFLDRSLVTGKGFSEHSHTSEGNTLYGINIVSTVKGTGRALYAEVHRLLEEMRLPYSIGITRLDGFSNYMLKVEPNSSVQANTDDIALWYTLESARILGLREWAECHAKPELDLPAILEPDPVLAFHVRGTTFGILGILPDYIIPDPESRNYGAVILSAFPHR